jgi:hypothetical protein
VTSRDLTPFGSVAVCLERQSLFAAVVGRHTAGVAFAERTVSGGRLSGRGKGVVKQTGVATRGLLFTLCTKKGCRYLVAPEPFGDGVRDLEECSGRVSEESAARTYCCSGRTWTLLALLSFRSDLDAAGSSCSGRRVKGNGMAGVPSQWEGTGQENGESGKAGVPSQWEGTGQERGERGKAGVPSQREGTGQESGESGKAGVPSQWEGTGQERGESGKAGVPSQWEGTGQESGESGKAEVPSQREGTGQESGKSGKAGVPSQREGTGQENGESGKAGVPSQ